MTKQELKELIGEMASTASTQKMMEAGVALSIYMMSHPQDTAEVMQWFNAARQKMMAKYSGNVPSPEQPDPDENFRNDIPREK